MEVSKLETTHQPISYQARLAAHAREQPDAPAISLEGSAISWSELERRSNRIARALSMLGVVQGDFVTVALPTGAPFLEACWGTWKLGATPQPVSWRLPRRELDKILEMASPRVVVADASFDSGKAPVTPDALLSLSSDESALPEVVSRCWKAMTSGGSTGQPKVIVSSEPAVYTRDFADVLRIDSQDVCLIPAPLYHNAPFVLSSVALLAGARVLLVRRFDAELVLKTIERERVTFLYAVPTMMGRIWKLPEQTKNAYDISSLKGVWHMGEPCPAWLKQEWIRWIGPQKIWEMYGGTEGIASTVIDGEEWTAHKGSVGKVMPPGEMRAFSPEGKQLPAMEVGELFMRRRGPVPAYRYLGSAATRKVGDWESIGDMGFLDVDGYVYLADRRSDLILIGGANVYPAEIEAALLSHPGVETCAVIGLPGANGDLANIIHAIIQPKGNLDETQIRSYLEKELVSYKWPRTYEFVSYSLKDEAGKMRRQALRNERVGRSTS